MAFNMKGSSFYGRGNQSKSSPATKVKETEAEFEARMKKQGMTISPSVEVKKSEKLTQRDILAKKAGAGSSGSINKGMEQSVKSRNYAEADKYMASKGNKDAKELIRKKASKTAEVKKILAKNPDMTQKEVDKLMSQS
tara:strand:- start:45 stop:458 length:414 start_codon:yes stop_codon:yes gene_type:complete